MNYLTLFFLLSTLLFAEEFDVSKVVEQVKSIKNLSKLSPNLDYRVYDPFATAKPILKEKKHKVWYKTTNKSIKIETILNDKVFIEKKWYATGDFIRGYKIKNIAKGNILLYKNGVYKKIYLKSSKNIVKIEEKIQ